MPKVLDDYRGLSFHIYFQDHPPPHVHVVYGEFDLQINIQTIEPLKGFLPPKKRKLALDEIREKQAILLERFAEYSAD